jgi:DNA replication protein DnaC
MELTEDEAKAVSDLSTLENSRLGEYGLPTRCDIPKRFRCKTVFNFEGHNQEVALAKRAILSGKSVVLSGPSGTGKTHLAVGLARLWYEHNIPIDTRFPWAPTLSDCELDYPQFAAITELLDRLKRDFGDDTARSNVLDRFSRRKLLIIDDIGSEKSSDWARCVIYIMLDRRYRDVRQTIVTTNLSMNELSAQLDDRIASRLAEMGLIIRLKGEDYRLRLQEQYCQSLEEKRPG